MRKEKIDEFLELVKKLDRTIARYGNDSKEADVIRDEMDTPWYALTAEEQDFVRTNS